MADEESGSVPPVKPQDGQERSAVPPPQRKTVRVGTISDQDGFIPSKAGKGLNQRIAAADAGTNLSQRSSSVGLPDLGGRAAFGVKRLWGLRQPLL